MLFTTVAVVLLWYLKLKHNTTLDHAITTVTSGWLWYLKLKHKHDTLYHAITTVSMVLLWYLKLKHKHNTLPCYYQSKSGFTVIFEVRTQTQHFIIILPQ